MRSISHIYARNISKTGNSISINLPFKICNQLELSKGREVAVYCEPDKIVIITDEEFLKYIGQDSKVLAKLISENINLKRKEELYQEIMNTKQERFDDWVGKVFFGQKP